MVYFALFFALGIWYLQQQATLPDLPALWPLAAFTLLLPRPEHLRVARVLRTLFIAASALWLGYGYAGWMAQQRLADSLPDEWQGRDIIVTGIVAEMPREHERGLRFTFDVERVRTPGAQVPQHILLSTYDSDSKHPLLFSPGQRWLLTVRLKQPHGGSNPHGFDFEAWALERNLRATGYVHPKGEHLLLAEQTASPAYLVQRLRETVRTHFRNTLGEAPYAGILVALAIGDQASIKQQEWQLFTRTGVNHLMSISGLHITLFSGMVFSLFYWLWRRSHFLTLHFPARKAAAIAGLTAALFYTLVSGYEIPAQRTLYMIATFTAMLLLSRNFALSQMLAAALLVVLLLDPWAILSSGFWLSFGAVALIFYVSGNRIRRSHWLMEYGKVQWAMTIGLIPPLLALFQQLSLVSPVANAFAIPLVSFIVVPLTLLGTLPPLEWMLYLAHQAMHLCMFLLQLLDHLPNSVWIQHAPPSWTIAVGVLGALWLLAPAGFPMRPLGSLLLLPMFMIPAPTPTAGSARITIFDVGQGLAVSVQTHSHALLYDTGPDFSGEADSGNRILLPALRGMGIMHLDTLLLSHNDMDHIGGSTSILQGMPVGRILTSIAADSGRFGTDRQIEHCEDGNSWVWDGVTFEILHPAATATSASSARDNDQSCVLRISSGQHSLLLAADIEQASEQRLMRLHPDKLHSTLLVAPHHGSKSSSSPAWVAAVRPQHVVFSSGYRNRYGHPHETVVERYRNIGSTVLRTDQGGAISVLMANDSVDISLQRQTQARYWHHNISITAAPQ